jgi:ankyrin repeat protein
MADELAKAAFDGDVEAVGRLLDNGADIDAEGHVWNPLHAAIENENVACVQLLIRRGADVERRAAGDLSPLAHAVDIAIDGTIQRGGNPGDEPTEIVNVLLDSGADPKSGLRVARDYGSSKIIELLTSAVMRRLT